MGRTYTNPELGTISGAAGEDCARVELRRVRSEAYGIRIAGAMRVFVNDADMLGTSLFGYAKNVVREVISVGRSGTLVDWEGDYEQRAYASSYRAEDILNWRVGRVNGRNVPTPRVLVVPARAP
jgi:hypothetical protein